MKFIKNMNIRNGEKIISIKEEIKNNLNEVFDTDIIIEVYFTDTYEQIM